MHSRSLPDHRSTLGSTPRSAAALVLALARTLHRTAQAGTTAAALPVLRRVLATGAMHGLTLPGLHRQREHLQRKHVLRMLAAEAGHDSWEDYRAALATLSPAELTHFDLWRGSAGYPNLWFSTREQALSHSAAHGGRVITVGQQAVVLTAG